MTFRMSKNLIQIISHELYQLCVNKTDLCFWLFTNTFMIVYNHIFIVIWNKYLMTSLWSSLYHRSLSATYFRSSSSSSSLELQCIFCALCVRILTLVTCSTFTAVSVWELCLFTSTSSLITRHTGATHVIQFKRSHRLWWNGRHHCALFHNPAIIYVVIYDFQSITC